MSNESWMLVLEYSAAILSLLSVLSAAKLSRHTFSLGGAGAVLFGIFFYLEEFYFSSFLQVYYFGMSVWGYFHWKDKERVKELIRNSFSFKTHLCVVILVILIGFYLSTIFPSSKLGFTDATLMLGSVINTYFLVKADRRTWLYWMLIDCVYIWQFATGGLVATTVLYSLYLLTSLRNYLLWDGVSKGK